jgi:hypothetical protein
MMVALLLAAAQACVDQSAPYPPGGTGGRDGTGGSHGGGTGGTGGGAGSGGTGGSGGTAGSGGAAGSGGTGGTGGIGGEAGTGGAGGSTSLEACNNPDDIAALTTLATNARQVSAQCAVTECQLAFAEGQEALITCVNECVQREIPGLSQACTACYGALEWCNGSISQLCWTECANTPCQPACLECGEPGCSGCALQCRIELDLCTGRMSTDCDT